MRYTLNPKGYEKGHNYSKRVSGSVVTVWGEMAANTFLESPMLSSLCYWHKRLVKPNEKD